VKLALSAVFIPKGRFRDSSNAVKTIVAQFHPECHDILVENCRAGNCQRPHNPARIRKPSKI
jgi:hypothetical protein